MKNIMKCFLLFLLLAFSGSNLFSQEGSFMDQNMLYKTNLLVAGSLILVESAILLIGMNIPEVGSWSNGKNLALASSDILLGGLLVYSFFYPTSISTHWLLAIYGVLGATHIFRDIEYFQPHWGEPFAANRPLFIFNNIRLGFVGAGFGLSLHLSY